MHVYVCMWLCESQKLMLGVFLHCSLLQFVKEGSLTEPAAQRVFQLDQSCSSLFRLDQSYSAFFRPNLELSVSARLVSHWASTTCLPPLPTQHCDYRCAHLYFYMGAGDANSSPSACTAHCSQRDISLGPNTAVFDGTVSPHSPNQHLYTDENGNSKCGESSLFMEAVNRFSMPCLDIKATSKDIQSSDQGIIGQKGI